MQIVPAASLTARAATCLLTQVVSNHLPWSDVLSSRLACTHWRAALESLITQLRVHVAAGCSNTGRAAGQMQHPGEVLHAGLQRLPCVASVQLMPTEHTTAADLAAVLDVVAVQVGHNTVGHTV